GPGTPGISVGSTAKAHRGPSKVRGIARANRQKPRANSPSSARDRRDADAGVALPVAGLLFERLLGAELVDRQFLAHNHRLDDLGIDLRTADIRLPDRGLPLTLAHQQDAIEGDLPPRLCLTALDQVDQDGLALADRPLRAGFFDDGVHGG